MGYCIVWYCIEWVIQRERGEIRGGGGRREGVCVEERGAVQYFKEN